MPEQGARRADAVRNRAAILAAAEAVFAERGPSASTEEVARRAGVAVGTVFRHFPTKHDLLAAILKAMLQRLATRAAQLAEGDASSGLVRFLHEVVEEAAARTTVVALLSRAGNDVAVGPALGRLSGAVEVLLRRGQQAGTLRPDVAVPEVLALLTSVTDGALSGDWEPSVRRRVLAVVVDGLRRRPDGSPETLDSPRPLREP